MPVSVLCGLSSGVPVPLHWLSRKPTVTHSHSGISFLDAWGKMHPSVGHQGVVQPLIYRAETYFVVVLSLHHLCVSAWVIFPCWWGILCVLKGRSKNITLISLQVQMWIKVGQIFFWVTLVYNPINLTGFGGITMPCILRIKAKMNHFERINPTAIASWFFLCK